MNTEIPEALTSSVLDARNWKLKNNFKGAEICKS